MQGPPNRSIEAGTDTLMLQCVADGSAPLTYSWTIPGGSNAANDANIEINLVGGISILVIPMTLVDNRYNGEFICTATNPGGSDSASAIISVFSGLLLMLYDINITLITGFPDNAIVFTVTNVNDPDPPNNCNNFDSNAFDVSTFNHKLP